MELRPSWSTVDVSAGIALAAGCRVRMPWGKTTDAVKALMRAATAVGRGSCRVPLRNGDLVQERYTAALLGRLLETPTLYVASQTLPILDESIFKAHCGTRPVHIGTIDQIDDIMHKGQGGM